jgi:hypothetical protein
LAENLPSDAELTEKVAKLGTYRLAINKPSQELGNHE